MRASLLRAAPAACNPAQCVQRPQSSCSGSGSGAPAGAAAVRRRDRVVVVAAAAAAAAASARLHCNGKQQQQVVKQQTQQQQQRWRRSRSSSSRSSSSSVRCRSAAPSSAAALSSLEEAVGGPQALEPEVFEIITYALKLAWTAETYTVHSWSLLLGLLKREQYPACKVLQELGLDDLYGAWHEVLWALNAADGLAPRAFTARVAWGERASLIAQGAVRFAGWAGRDKVSSYDLLMAFAASDVLAALFPDVDLSFPRVRRAVERASGVPYSLPDDGADGGAALSSSDMFV